MSNKSELEQMREILAIIPPARLRMLADYHEKIIDPMMGHTGTEIQDDLRKMADMIEKLP